MESKKINQLATELAPELSDLTIIGDPSTGISKKITLSQMASLFTGTVEEYANLASFPLVGTGDTIYIALDTNIIYRWNTGTTAYVELSPNIVTSLVFSDANGFDGTISLVGSTATLTITTALTTGSVAFIGASGALLQDNANFFWDDSNNRLGIGTNAPTTAIDVFGSGIIGRLNGTSTNNSFLGFASAGTNKWSIGNVQSDHRFRIYSEANTAELISILQTGEFGIGIANPTTKLHIDGGANALIANLDANVSVAKSISFRSDNSNRINLEVSGTESGSNAGADLFIRTYTDAGSLLNTILTITRSTSVSSFNGSINITAGNGILAGGGSFNISPSSTRGVIQINGSTDQFLSLGTNGYLQGSSTLVRLQSTPNLDFVVGGSQRLIINASTGVSTFNNDIYSITGTGLLIGGGSYAIGPTSTRGIIALNGSGDQILTFSSQSYLYNSSSLFRLLSSNDLDFVIGGTQRMIIKASSGAVGVGTSSPGTSTVMTIKQNSTLAGALNIINRNSTQTWNISVDALSVDDKYLAFTDVTNASVRMTLTNEGNLNIQGNGNGFTIGQASGVNRLDNNGTTFRCLSTVNSFMPIAASAFNVNSDYRLKEDLKPFNNSLDILNKIKIYDFKWKQKEERNYGVIAHELQEILPYIVYGKKDAMEKNGDIQTQGVDYGKIVPILIKGIQDLKTELDALKSK